MKSKNYPRMAAVLAMVLLAATSLWSALPATPCYAVGGYEEGGVGGGGGGIPSSYTSLLARTDNQGIITRDTIAETSDGRCQLTLDKGTKALNRLGNRLTSILMIKSTVLRDPPPNSNIIGLVYSLKPDGATFDPPITITFKYDPSDIPEGVNEENLVIVYWDGTAWQNLEGPFTVDVENHTISAPISHFTDFTVIAATGEAAFVTSSLTISPAEINPGQDIAISFTVTNNGDLADNYEVVLKIDNKVIDSLEVTLAGHTSQTVTLSTTANYAAGDHVVRVNGLSGKLTIKEPVPSAPAPSPPPPPAPSPPPSPPVTPPAPAPAPPTAPAVVPPAQLPTPTVTPAMPIIWWWLIGGIAIVIIILVVIWLLVTRRRYRYRV